MKTTVQYNDLNTLIEDIDAGMRAIVPEVEKVVARGALNVKNDWRDRWSGHPHIKHLPRAISYDLDTQQSTVDAEIGPDKDKAQGALGNVIEFGTVNNAPIPGGLPALEAETPKFVRALADVAEKEMVRRGLG